MLKSISCLVETPKDAGEIIERLLAAGFSRSEITILFAENEHAKPAAADINPREPERASVRRRGERHVTAFHNWSQSGEWRLQLSNVL